MNKKAQPLSGANNKRIDAIKPTNSIRNGALTDVEQVIENSQITIPSEDAILEAKDWVDNGSRL